VRTFLVGVAGVLVGIGLHATFGAKPAPAAPAARCEMDWMRMRGELHGVVRDTLVTTLRSEAQRGLSLTTSQAASGAPAGDVKPPGVAPPSPPSPPTPQQKQALTDHAALLAAAEKRGTWTEADVQTARGLVAMMAATDRSTALSALAQAINGGKLRVEAVPPF